VLDEDGNPVPDVKVIATSKALPEYETSTTTNKKGKFLFSHVDGTKVYQYRFEKEGYQTMVENVKPTIGGVISLEFTLHPPMSEAEGSPGGGLQSADTRAILTYNEGAQAQEEGDLDLAEKRFREALEIDPTLGAAFAALAGIAHTRGDYSEAASLAEQALEIDPNDARALHIRYDAYRQLGDTEKAEQAAKDLQAAGGSSDAAKRIYNEGAEAYNSGDLDTAATKFQEAITLDPTLTRAYIVLAGIHLRKGDFPAALQTADQALVIEPENVDALKLKYDAARGAGDSDAVESALTTLGKVDPEWAATGLYDHAVELFNAGNQAAAAAALEEVVKVDPDHAKAHYWLGMSLFNTGEVERAEEHLRKFLELAPDDPDAPLAKEILQYSN
jgi:tetratricopeptide (TPR) repeat protein